jgi:hypothetical protein
MLVRFAPVCAAFLPFIFWMFAMKIAAAFAIVITASAC